jgi:hypothetical protein
MVQTSGTADRVWLGQGVETGSFTFHYLRDGKTISVFSVYTTGRLALNYGWLITQWGKDVLQEFHQRITEAPAFKKIPADFTKYPTVALSEAFKGKDDLEKFEQVVVWLRERMAPKA